MLRPYTSRWRTLIVAGVVALIMPESVQAQERPNLVGGEIAGRALAYSVNYERNFKRAGLGVGFATWRIDRKFIAIVPMYVSYKPVGQKHSLYLSAGATVGSVTDTLFAEKTAVFGTATIGYERLSESGFVLRPTLNFLITRDDHLWWPGLLLGYRF
jgi:hypothetical protein